MALVDPQEFDDKEVAPVYIAGRPGEAKRVEQLLGDNGIDFVVDVQRFETYLLGVLPTEYEGVTFSVLSGQARFCRRVLYDAGLRAGLIEEGME